MHESTASELGPDQPTDRSAGLTRRQVIARGAAGGAVLWAVPTLQIIGATAADAASGPVVQQPPREPVDPPSVPTAGLPGHGFAVVDGGSGPFVVKIDSDSLGSLSGLGNQDERFLQFQRDTGEGTDYRQPTSADLAAFGVAGDGFGATWYSPPGATAPQAALFLVLPSGHILRQAFTFDGSLQAPGSNGKANGNGNSNGQGNGNAKDKDKDKRKDGCGDGDKYTAAHLSGRLVYFVATCNEPATGEA